MEEKPEKHHKLANPTPKDIGRHASEEASASSPFVPGQSAAAKHADLIILGLAIIMLIIATVSLMLGRYPIEPDKAFLMLLNQLPFVNIEPTWDLQQSTMFFNVRLPRILLAMMVGCCLAVAGASFQGTFQNPLVSPDILGASQGAAFGAALAILWGWSSWGVSGLAFVMAIVTVMCVLLISVRAQGNRVLVTVLAGTMVSSLFGACVSFVKLVADPSNELPAITYWLMGSLNGAKVSELAIAAIPMTIGVVTLFALRWRINILTMGDDEATTMGVDAKRLRIVIILAATLVTAASVAVSGMIGWVGLVIPHLCRMMVGSDYRKLIPGSMFMGAGFLLLVDNISRLAGSSEIPIGILTAFVGAPFFLYLITRKKKGLL